MTAVHMANMPFAGEFGRRWIKRIEAGGDGTVQSINAFPWSGTQVMDMAFGPDGALYVLDYGTGYFNGDENSALYRVEHVTGGHAPVARAAANLTSGKAPLAVSFSAAGSSDADGDALRHAWDFGDGSVPPRPIRRTPTPPTASTRRRSR
ncbi:hypothetical protein STENM223S_09258 [Streptomyces tendae]